jgi:hypothetical protein
MPVFLKDWWLDLVCGEDNWDYVSFSLGDQIIAVWPYYTTKGKYNQKISKLPKLTPFLGPWITYPANQKYCSKLSFEKKVLFSMIDQLPKHDLFLQNINSSVINRLPFYWKGFDQRLSYTYRLTKLEDVDRLFLNFKESVRTDIRKAQKELKVLESEDVETFYRINSLTFDRQSKRIPYSLKFIREIDNECKRRECKSILIATDKMSNVHAVIYLIWDNNYTYYLMGGADPGFRSSGAMSLLIWEAIKQAAKREQNFDFEGSMIEPIENYFRSFGSEQVSYLQIVRYSKKGNFLKLLSEIKKSIFTNL